MYGIYNTMRKCFQFNISEPTKEKALAKLFKLIGKDAYKWRFEARLLPKTGRANSDETKKNTHPAP